MKNTIINPVLPLYIIIPLLAVLLILLFWLVLRRRMGFKKTVLALLRMLLIAALIFMVNLRVMIGHRDAKTNTQNLDILFVFDNTLSMWAGDGRSNDRRMDNAIHDCEYIMNALPGANYALIQFNNSSQIWSPFTQDALNVSDALDSLDSPSEYYARGTSLNIPYNDIEKLLISSSQKENRKTVLFFFTDGEITNDEALKDYSPLAKYLDAGAVLGYGTESGGTIRLGGRRGGGQLLMDDETDMPAISKPDKKNMAELASALKIDCIQMESDTAVDSQIILMNSIAESVLSDSKAMVYEDTYFYWAIPLALMLVWEAILIFRKNRL